MTAVVIILGIFTVIVLDDFPLIDPPEPAACEVNVECECNGNGNHSG